MQKNKKKQIFELINQNMNNIDIAETTGTSARYVSKIRQEFNESADKPIPSRHSKPAVGTKARQAYDLIKADPLLSDREVADALKIDRGSVWCTRRRYFGSANVKKRTYYIEYLDGTNTCSALVMAETQNEAETLLINKLPIPYHRISRVMMLRSLPSVIQLQSSSSYRY